MRQPVRGDPRGATAHRPVPRFRVPWLTAFATALAAIAAVAQYAAPSLVDVFARDGHALAQGQWWRLVSPLLVQTLGWYQVLANLVTLPVVGVVAERLLGRQGWLGCAVAGAVGGQLSAYWQREPGGGDSILIAGLAGGVLVYLIAAGPRGPDGSPSSRWNGVLVLGYLAALTGWSLLGALGAAVAASVTAALLLATRRLELPGSIGALLVMFLLALRGDLHGAAVVAGALAAAAVVFSRRWRRARRRGRDRPAALVA